MRRLTRQKALFAVLRTVGRCVYLPGGSRSEVYDASYFDALAAEGYRYWDFTVIAEDYLDYASGASVRDSVIEALISVEFVQTLAMHSTQAAAEALPGLLDYIIERGGNGGVGGPVDRGRHVFDRVFGLSVTRGERF